MDRYAGRRPTPQERFPPRAPLSGGSAGCWAFQAGFTGAPLSALSPSPLGADLRDGARRILKLVVRANARRDKAPVLLELREEVEQLKVLLRLSHTRQGTGVGTHQ